MVRFIFLCMAVVALSAVTVGAQFLINSMKETQNAVMARNLEAAPTATDVAKTNTPSEETDMMAASFNDISTAAGAGNEKDEGFGASFTNVAPKALADDVVQPSTPTMNNQENAQP